MPLVHKHLIVRAQIKMAPSGRDLLDWIETLVPAIGMRIAQGPFCYYSEMVGNRGWTGVCIIETSHVAVHCWDEAWPALLQLDVYSCSHLDSQLVIDALKIFDPVKVEFKFLDREHSLIEADVV